MKNDNVSRNVSINGVPSFIGCLVLGTLVAIRKNAIEPEVAIWSLGIPGFWTSLKQRNILPLEIIEILKSSDEISALYELDSTAAEQFLDDSIAVLTKFLASIEEQSWSLSWNQPVRQRKDFED